MHSSSFKNPHTHTASPFTNVTQVVDVPMIDNRQCEQWHREKGINVIIYDEMVCAGYFHGGKVNTDQYDVMDIGDDQHISSKKLTGVIATSRTPAKATPGVR